MGVAPPPPQLISGLAIHGEPAVFTSSTTGAAAPPGGGGIGNLFGQVALGSSTTQGLLPQEPGQVHVNKLTGGQLVECSLINTSAWATSLIGAAVGIRLDATSNLFIVDPAATQCGNIVNVVVHGTQGLIGDFGVRVLVAPLCGGCYLIHGDSINSTNNLFQSQSKVLWKVFEKTTPEAPPIWDRWFNSWEGDPERSFFQILPFYGFGPLALKYEGQAPALDQAGEGTASMFPYSTYSLKYGITQEANDEDPMKINGRLPRLLRFAEDQTVELLLWNQFNQAFNTNVTIWDGLPLCSTAHLLASSPGVDLLQFAWCSCADAGNAATSRNPACNAPGRSQPCDLPYAEVPGRSPAVAEDGRGNPGFGLLSVHE